MGDCDDKTGKTIPTEGRLPYPRVYVNPDGTLVPRAASRQIQVTNYPAEVPIVTGRYVDDFTALQIGMFRILEDLTFTTIDRYKRIVDGTVAQNQMVFTRIFLDWPDSEDDLLPIPSVTIHSPQEVETTSPGPQSGQPLMEETSLQPPVVLQRLSGAGILESASKRSQVLVPVPRRASASDFCKA